MSNRLSLPRDEFHGYDQDELLEVSYDTALHAAQAMEKTPPPHEGRSIRWANSDFESFQATVELDDVLFLSGLRPVLPGRGSAGEHFTNWRRALPYNEAEDERFCEVRRENLGSTCLAREVRQLGIERIEDGGIERYAVGKHLVRRWWRWRRDLEEFEGQRGPERAVAALRLGAEALMPYLDRIRSECDE